MPKKRQHDEEEGRPKRQRFITDFYGFNTGTIKPMSRSRWIEDDLRKYRQGYPGEEDNPRLKENYLFYTNQLASKPSGDMIDEIHKNWYGNYHLLEAHHGYIQWLFPIREHGMNFHSQELMKHEIKAILNDKTAVKRLTTSYKMLLDFYGMKLSSEETGEVEKSANWEERFNHLNRSMHNHLRITRILKCLGEFKLENYQVEWLQFLMRAVFVEESLPNLRDSLGTYWIGCVKNNKERRRLLELFKEYERKRKPKHHEISDDDDSSTDYDTP